MKKKVFLQGEIISWKEKETKRWQESSNYVTGKTFTMPRVPKSVTWQLCGLCCHWITLSRYSSCSYWNRSYLAVRCRILCFACQFVLCESMANILLAWWSPLFLIWKNFDLCFHYCDFLILHNSFALGRSGRSWSSVGEALNILEYCETPWQTDGFFELKLHQNMFETLRKKGSFKHFWQSELL